MIEKIEGLFSHRGDRRLDRREISELSGEAQCVVVLDIYMYISPSVATFGETMVRRA